MSITRETWRIAQAYGPQWLPGPALLSKAVARVQYGRIGGFARPYKADVASALLLAGKMTDAEHDDWKHGGKLHDRFYPLMAGTDAFKPNLAEHIRKLPSVDRAAQDPAALVKSGLGLAPLALARPRREAEQEARWQAARRNHPDRR